MVSVALVDNSCAVTPALPRKAESAMVKQPACAAAMSSSGLVPTPFSKRVANEYGELFRTPPGADSVPLPCLRSPFQTADAVRFIILNQSLDFKFRISKSVFRKYLRRSGGGAAGFVAPQSKIHEGHSPSSSQNR